MALLVHLELRISLRIFEKFEMGRMVYSWAWGKLIHEKALSRKSRGTVPALRTVIWALNLNHKLLKLTHRRLLFSVNKIFFLILIGQKMAFFVL
jgi:hypothetical protein